MISELKKQGFDLEDTTEPINKKRMYRLKFYVDNKSRNQINEKCNFLVSNEEKAILLILYFERKGAYIRAAFLNPSDAKLAHTDGFRLDFKNHPLYISMKS